MLDGIYSALLRGHARQAVNVKVEQPNPSLGVGWGETLQPVALAVPQAPSTPQGNPRLAPVMNRDQFDNLKLLLPLSAADFPMEGGGF